MNHNLIYNTQFQKIQKGVVGLIYKITKVRNK